MPNWSSARLTEAGRNLLAKVEAGATLEITRMKMGDGRETVEELEKLTDLVSPCYIAGISSRTAENGVCHITAVAASCKNTKDFYAREWGVFANDPDVGEILYSFCIDSNPDFFPAAETNSLISAGYDLGLVVSNCKNIKVDINPLGLVTTEMLHDATNTLDRNREYRAGDIVFDNQLRPGQYLKCIASGTTADTELIIKNPYLNSIYNDGTAQWIIVTMASYEGDCFKRDREGNLRVSIPKHREGDPVLFTQDENGIRVADRFFYSWQFMWTAEGSIIARPTDYLGPDSKPGGGNYEDDDSTPTEAEMDELYEKLKAQAEKQANI